MVTYPYTVKVGSLRRFLQQIPSIGVPEKLTIAVLGSLGYKSKNDRRIIGILKSIGFLDASGKPTENYLQFRNTEKSRGTMASCIRTAYGDLFKTYPDAYNKDVEALRNFFSTSVTAGAAVLIHTVNTFRALCEFAYFAISEIPAMESTTPTIPPAAAIQLARASPQGLVINLNIQLQLPATEDSTIYDKIFQSLKRHILER